MTTENSPEPYSPSRQRRAPPPTLEKWGPESPRTPGDQPLSGEDWEKRTPFPTELLPLKLRDVVEHTAMRTSSPGSLCAAAGISAVSASLGSGLFIQSERQAILPGNLFILCIAASGTGKGRSFNAVLEPFYAEDEQRTRRWNTEDRPQLVAKLEVERSQLDRARRAAKKGAGPGDAAANAEISSSVRSIAELESALRASPALNIGNATAEGISEALAHAPGSAIAMISPEGRDIVNNLLGRYSKDGKGSDEYIFLQGYSGDTISTKRKGHDVVLIRDPRLTCCLAIQPDVWTRLSSDSRMIESGFLARAMSFDAEARPARPSDYVVPREVGDAWTKVIQDLQFFRDNPDYRVVQVSDGARAKIVAFAEMAADQREEGGAWRDITSFAARLAENTWRLALCLHAVEHGQDALNHPLPEATASAAIAVASWFFRETLHLLSPVRQERSRTRLEKLKRVLEDGPKRISDLDNRHGFLRMEVEALHAKFPDEIVLETSSGGPGRPSLTVRLASVSSKSL